MRDDKCFKAHLKPTQIKVHYIRGLSQINTTLPHSNFFDSPAVI
jgi:hypothetical protein